MIVEGQKIKKVEETISIYRCTECDAEFEHNDYGESAAREHAKTHESLVYFNKNGYGGVYVTERAVIRERGPYKMTQAINHRIEGNTYIEWKGEGWYVLHEYEEIFRGERDQRKKFVPVKDKIEDVKEKIRDLAGDMRHYHELKRAGKP